MDGRTIGIDPWSQTVGWLTLQSAATNVRARDPQRENEAIATRARCIGDAPTHANVVVSVIDRPTSSTATVAWCDPRSCRYGDQVWRASVARQPGVCALSGRSIGRGDAIYRPRACRPSPLNAGAMILATVVEDVPRG
ncbi:MULTISPECIES: DUF3331 domain-containing protein [unclassified Caballeronia]|uniref:DUF3331 domain-containing protein n=1 Tax=unclassified Caballeronia TaxID=2646786 RepID=UPI00285DAFEC|nr:MULTISPECIES: DUF3331 domain-containing protein [unclassified Caballeronia]MDR5753168.1 DUF3331 domain-containing protein [Caballeronia sp. LZ024]MDR5840907.1 DUF3331 domain-containing protein [Caballeronia sp. LZ031]